ncbi:MAG: RNA polymerase sigma factor [Proteobacteria bacterium]|nr:RNA polymerase sigma factor [Pseudomonadota bacterium]
MVEELATDCGRDLMRFIARRLKSTEDARDLAQETYARLLRLERKDLIRDPRSYLYRVACNVLYEFELGRKADALGLRRWAAERNHDSDSELIDVGADALTLQRQLESTMKGLSPKCRAVVTLHRREGMTYDEIAKQLGISPSMVKKYLAQGLLHCRERLKDFR